MLIEVKKVFLKKTRNSTPIYGVSLFKSVKNDFYIKPADIYIIENKYSIYNTLKKIEPAKFYKIVETDYIYSINIPEEYISFVCNKDLIKKEIIKDKEKIISFSVTSEHLDKYKYSALTNPVSTRDVYKTVQIYKKTKYKFLKGHLYYVTSTSHKTITFVDHNLKEITFDKDSKNLEHFEINVPS